eukprot:2597957-Pyramimonas_sp.AAC.1
MKDGCEEHQQQVYAAIEHAAAGMSRRPSEWPSRLVTQWQRQVIHERCHCYLRGASEAEYATLEGADDQGPHVE